MREMRDKPQQIRTDAGDLSDYDGFVGPAHVYLGHGPFPSTALCGWRLYDEDGVEGNPPDEDDGSMAATRLKARYDSLGDFFGRTAVCSECKAALAERLGYDSVGDMMAEHVRGTGYAPK